MLGVKEFSLEPEDAANINSVKGLGLFLGATQCNTQSRPWVCFGSFLHHVFLL